MVDNTDSDFTRAYNVYMDNTPISDFQGSAYDGDIYARVGRTAEEYGIYVQTEGRWIAWNPNDVVEVVMVDLVAYATPCDGQGLKYVATTEEALRALTSMPADMPALVQLIGNDIHYPHDLKRRKRSPPADGTSQPRKRSRTKQTTPADVDTDGIRMEEDQKEGGSNGNHGGSVTSMGKGPKEATTTSGGLYKDDFAAQLKNMELEDGPGLQGKGTTVPFEGKKTDIETDSRSDVLQDFQKAPAKDAHMVIDCATSENEPAIDKDDADTNEEDLHNGECSVYIYL